MWICGRPANSVPMKEGEIKFNLSSLDPYLDKNLINYAWKLPAIYSKLEMVKENIFLEN